MTTRTYTKTVLPDKLQSELQEKAPGLVDSISFHDDITTLFLTRDPTGVEDQALTDAVNDHAATYLNYTIWDYVLEPAQKHLSPADVNFSLLPLAKKDTYVKGELTTQSYYGSASVDAQGVISYADLVLEATWVYTRDPLGFAVYAEETVRWMREDGEFGPDSKVIPHYFDGLKKIREGSKRRSNIVDGFLIPISEMLIYNKTVARMTELSDPSYSLTTAEIEVELQRGRDLMNLHKDALDAFKGYADDAILAEITDDTTSTMLNLFVPNTSNTVTIRQYILSELDIWST